MKHYGSRPKWLLSSTWDFKKLALHISSLWLYQQRPEQCCPEIKICSAEQWILHKISCKSCVSYILRTVMWTLGYFNSFCRWLRLTMHDTTESCSHSVFPFVCTLITPKFFLMVPSSWQKKGLIWYSCTLQLNKFKQDSKICFPEWHHATTKQLWPSDNDFKQLNINEVSQTAIFSAFLMYYIDFNYYM